jgi:SAM-dependent methyltransferase
MIDFDAFARFYDADAGTFADDLPFYAELAHRTGGTVLDAMCGTGRVILPLAEQGLSVAGLDVSPAMLALGRQKAEEAGVSERVQLVQGDIRDFDVGQHFGLLVVPINSFMHLDTVDDQLAALACLRNHMHARSLLVLDLFNPTPQDLGSDQNVLVYDRTFALDGANVQKYVVRHTDWSEQRQHVQFIYDEQGGNGTLRRHVLPFTMRWLYRFELEHLLIRAGFVIESWFGDYELGPYTNESAHLIVVAHRAR